MPGSGRRRLISVPVRIILGALAVVALMAWTQGRQLLKAGVNPNIVIAGAVAVGLLVLITVAAIRTRTRSQRGAALGMLVIGLAWGLVIGTFASPALLLGADQATITAAARNDLGKQLRRNALSIAGIGTPEVPRRQPQLTEPQPADQQPQHRREGGRP